MTAQDSNTVPSDDKTLSSEDWSVCSESLSHMHFDGEDRSWSTARVDLSILLYPILGNEDVRRMLRPCP